jgi:sugar/nucleoside kinase (ribokinase family)
MANHDLVVLGDCNPDLLLCGDVIPAFGQAEKLVDEAALTIGGSGAIVAAGAARLGVRTALVGVVGDDNLGRLQLDALSGRGVDVSGVSVDPSLRTGVSVILSHGEDRAILTSLGTIAALGPEAVDFTILRAARHVHVSSYFLQDRLRPEVGWLLAEARRAGASTSLDPNWDPTERWNGGLRDVLPYVDYFLANEQEVCRITRCESAAAAARELAGAVKTVAVKQGARGAIAVSGTELLSHPAPHVEVVDTTGAGDSFDAGFLTGVLRGWGLDRSLELACTCGSLSATALGVDAQPTLAAAQDAFTSSRP